MSRWTISAATIAVALALSTSRSARAAAFIGSYSNRAEATERGYAYREYSFAKPSGAGKHYIVYLRNRPEYAYFYNPEAGRYWGRCELASGKYSLLPKNRRAARVADIPENAFLPPGEMPPPQSKMTNVRMLPPPECLAKGEVASARQFCTRWVYDPDNRRFLCEYYFKPAATDPAYQRQIVACYTDPQLRQHLYYFNEQKESFWGRCANKNHPAFDPAVSQWERRSDGPAGGQWTPLPPGDPPVPGSRDGVAIRVPDPPF